MKTNQFLAWANAWFCSESSIQCIGIYSSQYTINTCTVAYYAKSGTGLVAHLYRMPKLMMIMIMMVNVHFSF